MMIKNINLELTNLLKDFQEGYTNRDVSVIDAYMDRFFDKEDNIIIIGTSINEWCFGYEGAKDLIESDWECWGDLKIDIDKADITEYGNVAFINTPGTVKYTFKHDDKTYTRYLNTAKEILSEENVPNKIKLAEINNMLCHFLHQRDKLINDYLWNVNITFILVKREEKWYIRQMQFAMPVNGHYPDARIFEENYYHGEYNLEINDIKEYSKNSTCPKQEAIKNILNAFINSFPDKDETNISIAERFFTDEATFINHNQRNYRGLKEISSIISEYKNYYDSINLNIDDALINSHNDVVWVAANGLFKKNMTEEDIFNKAKVDIDKICEKNVDDKEKLFRIRRTITGAVKENIVGEEFVWPFRFEGILVNKDNRWVFEYTQFSYPFDMILEGKTDAITDRP